MAPCMGVIYDPDAIAYDYPAVAGIEFHRLWPVSARMPSLFTGTCSRCSNPREE